MALRIAILTCDTPVPEANRRHNGYGGLFTSLLESSATANGLDPECDLEVTVFDIVDGDQYPNLEDIDAILLTGSSEFCEFDLKISVPVLTLRQNTTPTTIPHGFYA